MDGNMIGKNVLYYGRDDPLPERIPLRAGPLSLIFEQGDLRYVKWRGHEVWRRIYVAIRDKDWGTVPPVLSHVEVEKGADSFRISYEVENRRGEVDFRWRGEIVGTADGTVVFSMDGAAHTSFLRNRIGFCLLHPASCAGAPCRVEHVDGSVEETRLPTYVVPEQPVRPFHDMGAMTHEVAPGVWGEARFSGEVFEMEDQRNWTDASFKTFCTPVHLPRPVQVDAGARLAQSIALKLSDERSAAQRQPISGIRVEGGGRSGADSAAVLTLRPAEIRPIPSIGFGVASHGRRLSTRELERLRALHLRHLRVDLLISDASYLADLSRATAEADALGVPLEVALLLGDRAEDELRGLRSALDRLRPRVARWLVYPRQEHFARLTPIADLVIMAREQLASYDPTARFGGGTNADLVLLLRQPLPVSLLDFACFAINPQTHAFDNSSLVETLQAQGTAVASARRAAGGLPVVVSPVTLKPRFNPYSSGMASESPTDELPPQVDERQMSLLGAGWTAGSLKYLSESGAQSLTYYETTGWRGVMETEDGPRLPGRFQSTPGAVYPLYHVLADVGEIAGGDVIPVVSSDALRLDGLALRRGDRVRVIVANLSPEPQRAVVQGLVGRVGVRRLDETSFGLATRSPETWRAEESPVVDASRAGLELELPPYACARVDGRV